MNSSTAQTWVPSRLGVVVIIDVLAALLSTAALAQNEPTRSSPQPSASQSPDAQVLSKREREVFLKKMEQIPMPGKGCLPESGPVALSALSLFNTWGFIANNRRPRQLLRTYRPSHYDSCGERAEMIVKGFHFKSGTKG